MQNDNSESQICSWRDDIDSLVFYPAQHDGFCAMHRRAFRTLLDNAPTAEDCLAYFNTHHEVFQAAAAAKILRDTIALTNSLHINSRDIRRAMKG